ncbi:rho guanine nucleotide exchange factor 15-like [Hyla sarda]|uniref:rho guanine nucleotide exchange factor 15-like n=1 Tax=Hyla sarda TaxID=327740 RepID=UPI0024C34A5B|nr:rho guanine nucleotide exchange factor 15-like [Hyla sarda]
MSATDALPPPIPLSQKPVRIIKARPPNRPPPHLPPKPPQKPSPCPKHAPVPPACQPDHPEPTAEPTTSGVCVKKIAGLFQKDPAGGSSDDPQPRLPPKPSALLPKEDKVPPTTKEEPPSTEIKSEVKKPEEQSCPPPLPPKLFQDPDERLSKMASCLPRPACPSRCCCACHQQRPGMVLVWLPESSVVSPGLHVNEASDSSDDSGVFQRVLSINDDEDEEGGKWGSWHLKDKMNVGTCYPIRRRSLKYAERSQQDSADGVGKEKVRNSVVLTSYKSTAEESFNGEETTGEGEKGQKCERASNAPEIPKHGPPNHRKARATGHVETAVENDHSETSTVSNRATHDPQPEAPKNPKYKSISFSTDVISMVDKEVGGSDDSIDSKDPLQPNEGPNSDPVTLRGAGEIRSKIRKPARRSKVPPLSVCEVPEPPPTLPPKVPSKPPRGAAPPPPPAPPPFLRKGSLKRYSLGNTEEMTDKDKKMASNSLPIEAVYKGKDSATSGEDASDSLAFCSDSSVSRTPTVKSPKSIDWESHLRDEPLYQTYRQSVINKEIRRQTVSRNCSFTSYDSSQESPLSAGGSPKPGRRSSAPHNTLWQELPCVIESGVLESMSNDEKKIQESMFEVLTSEASYLRSLNVLTEHFLGNRDLQESLVVREKKILFSNVLKVKEVSERFLMDLESRVDEDVIISDVCDIIYHHAINHFSVYIDYVRNQVYQEKTYSELMEKNPQFHALLCRLQELPQCQRLPFMSFLLLPFQRITRIKMLIENILKRTEEGSECEQNASKALDSVSKIIQECNREVGRMKQTEELIYISSKIEFDKIKAVPFISHNRFLEKQGELSEVQQKGSLFGIKPNKLTPVYFFLFNDLLLITQKKSSDRYVVLDYAHRSLVQVQSCPTMENSFFLTLLENHQRKTCDRLFKAPTQSDMHRWVAVFPSKNSDSSSGSDTIYEDWDCPQVHCVEQYMATQADELTLEPSDIINVLRKTSEGWYEGIRLSDGKKGWFPSRYVQEITNEHVRRRNLRERYRVLQAARQMTGPTDT